MTKTKKEKINPRANSVKSLSGKIANKNDPVIVSVATKLKIMIIALFVALTY